MRPAAVAKASVMIRSYDQVRRQGSLKGGFGQPEGELGGEEPGVSSGEVLDGIDGGGANPRPGVVAFFDPRAGGPELRGGLRDADEDGVFFGAEVPGEAAGVVIGCRCRDRGLPHGCRHPASARSGYDETFLLGRSESVNRGLHEDYQQFIQRNGYRHASSTPARPVWAWRSPRCEPAPASPTGYCSDANALSGP